MRKCSVFLDSILFRIFSFREPPCSPEGILCHLPRGAYAIFEYPSDIADFSLECYGRDGAQLSEPYLPLSAFAYFLRKVRGLPSFEFDVEYFGKIHSVSEQLYMPWHSEKLDKCKLLLTKQDIMSGNVTLTTYFAKGESSYRILPCDDAFCVDSLVLSSLRLFGGELVDTAVAASFDGVVHIRSSGLVRPLESVAYAAMALLENGKIPKDATLIAESDVGRHTLLIDEGKIRFIPSLEC